MLRILIAKTSAGPVITAVDPNFNPFQKPQNVVERYDAFFRNAPTWGGKEWQTLSLAAIAAIFLEAAGEIRVANVQHYQTIMKTHGNRTPLGRWWQVWWHGWEAPANPTHPQIIATMVKRCRDLAAWMEENAKRPFFAGSDMRCYIEKPRAVAILLENPPGTTPAAMMLGNMMITQTSLTGAGLGSKLRNAGFTHEEAKQALLEKGFTVQLEDTEWATILHVSMRPASLGIETALALMGASGEVAWHKSR